MQAAFYYVNPILLAHFVTTSWNLLNVQAANTPVYILQNGRFLPLDQSYGHF